MRLRNYLKFQLLFLFDVVDGFKVRFVFDLGGLLEGIQLRPNTEIMLLRSKKLVVVVMTMLCLSSYGRDVALFLFLRHSEGVTGLTMTTADGAQGRDRNPNGTTGLAGFQKRRVRRRRAKEIPVWMATREDAYHFQAQLGVSRALKASYGDNP